VRLFGSSGIRGLVNFEITPLLAQKVGKAISSQFEGGAILVGRDSRTSGLMLEKAFVSGVVSCGCVSGILGVIPTPGVAWLSKEMEAEAGVSISASHNPPQYNGIKVFGSTGMAYSTDQQSQLEGLIETGEFTLSTWNRVGMVEQIEAARFYVDALVQHSKSNLEWRLVCDLFNGATCTVAHEIFEELGYTTTLINAQVDGNFPSGNPEPSQTSLAKAAYMVKELNADIGFGFDGDGDRMMVVDDQGNIPSPDRVLAAYSKHIVETNKGGIVVTHVGASMNIDEVVEISGGSVVRTKVGDVHITQAIIEHGAIFGGEPVGAWVHPEIHLCPDGLLSAIKLIEVLEKEEKSISEFISEIPEYPTLRTKVDCPNNKKAGTMKSVSDLGNEFGEVKEVSIVDGVRLRLDDGWVLIRPSGTEPVIRITVEAYSKSRAEDLLKTSRKFVQKVLGV
jgi:phosphoglucosamine mutase